MTESNSNKQRPRFFTVGDIFEGFSDKGGDAAVVGYGGKLNIRPPFQRNFVYPDTKQEAVIHTVLRELPLNLIIWVQRDDGGFEMLDGQQRTLSLCHFVEGRYHIKTEEWGTNYFHGLPEEVQKRILDYELMVSICDLDGEEKLRWFKTINTPGLEMTDQELRNPFYTGKWLSDAKRYFSCKGEAAARIAKDYTNAVADRQGILETAIKWHLAGQGEGKNADKEIHTYMGAHKNADNASELWAHFQGVIKWIKAVFPKVRKTQMHGVDWGALYAKHSGEAQDAATLEERVKELMSAEAIDRKSGIYPFVLDGKRKHLNMRAFPPHIKTAIYEKHGGKCALCDKQMKDESEAHADHIEPWRKDGATTAANCQILCIACNLRKGGA